MTTDKSESDFDVDIEELSDKISKIIDQEDKFIVKNKRKRKGKAKIGLGDFIPVVFFLWVFSFFTESNIHILIVGSICFIYGLSLKQIKEFNIFERNYSQKI